jgi:heat shock protein HtpX
MKGISVFKTGMLMLILTLLLVAVGKTLDVVFHTSYIMWIFLAFSLGMNFFSYWYSDKVVLKMYKAREVPRDQGAWLYEMVERLCRNAKIPMPKLYILPTPAPNAFATGRDPNHAAVAVTNGIISALSAEELEGVLAHELAHIKNRDTLISTLVAGVAGIISTIGHWATWFLILGGGGGSNNDRGGFGAILLLLLAPFFALIVQLMISRQREYLADSTGAEISGRPIQLANALEKIEDFARRQPLKTAQATSHLFIINPFKGDKGSSLFSTHPSTADRVKKLHEKAREMRVFH